jgi:hypothetical protein
VKAAVVTQAPHTPNGDDLAARQAKSRRARNIAIGLTLGFLVLLFYVVTVVKLGPGALQRPI